MALQLFTCIATVNIDSLGCSMMFNQKETMIMTSLGWSAKKRTETL